MSNPSSSQTYIPSFNQKLRALDANTLPVTGYPKEYLQLLLKNSLYYLHIYAHVLDKVLKNTNKRKEELVLVDYGAGNGLLGMFAKHCGFNKVYLNDISSIFIHASKELSIALRISIDGFITGDCEGLFEFSKANDTVDAVVGTDVIEHIYSLEKFFSCLKKINKEVVTVFTTASVTDNPIKNKQLMKLQYADEHTGSNAGHSIPGNEFAGLAFFDIRRKIIERSFTSLNNEVVADLAKATRGLNEADLVEAVKKYTHTSEIPKPPSHPTNTCDPVTGSWTERLLTISEYKKIYNEAGFSLAVFTGFYNEWQRGIKTVPLKIINYGLRFMKGSGTFFSPFITLVGK